jgi:hypothetical protein
MVHCINTQGLSEREREGLVGVICSLFAVRNWGICRQISFDQLLKSERAREREREREIEKELQFAAFAMAVRMSFRKTK